MILDIRIHADRNGVMRATVEGRRIDIPRTTSAADALRMVASRLDAIAWAERISTMEAARRPI